jgi:hypothetical protein
MKNKKIELLKNVFIISLPTLLVVVIILEIFFRTVIIASDSPLSEYDRKYNYSKFSNKVKTGIYTIGKCAQIKSKWSINNYGFNFYKDFKLKNERDSLPLICVLGDSYIEAFQVDADKNYPVLLDKNLINYHVYGVGISGSPLSQYLHYNKIVNQLFDPSIIVYQLVHNDFDESLSILNPNSVFHTVDKNENGV